MTGTPGARSPIPRLRAGGGVAALGYGFRPFFLLAGISAALGIALWLADLAQWMTLPGIFAPVTWHAHEMLFGFTMAAVGGFFLTAIPNWTGRLPLSGQPLLGLVLVWLAGRLAISASALIGGWAAAAIDLAFPAALMLVVVREVAAGRNWRNLPMAAAVGLLLVANALMHAEALGLAILPGSGWRLAVAVVTVLIALIGGRIIPSFTRNWLVKRGVGEAGLPVPFGRFDMATLAVTAAGLLSWVASPGSSLAVVLTAAAAILCAVRLFRWQGRRTTADPLVFILHLGWAWVPIGLGLLAIAQAAPAVLPEIAALHALTAGAIGTMILAVMTRATLGHTGRALHAGAGTVVVYLLVSIAAVARVAAGFLPEAYDELLWLSGLAWLAAFTGFVAIYGPYLLRPRPDGKPG